MKVINREWLINPTFSNLYPWLLFTSLYMTLLSHLWTFWLGISTPDGWNDWQFFLWIFFFWINHLDSFSVELAMNFAIFPGLSFWLHCVVNSCFYFVSWCLFALTHVFRLLTPPGTPLFPSLERESPKTVRSQDGSPKARPTALKSRVRIIILLYSEKYFRIWDWCYYNTQYIFGTYHSFHSTKWNPIWYPFEI